MRLVQGTVNKIWHNRRPDGSEYWVVSVDGQRYTTSRRDLVEGIQEGDRIELSLYNSGRYRRIAALARLPHTAFVTADRLLPNPESLRIIRMNCLRTAAEMLKDTTLLPEQKLAMAITVAERLEQHVLRPRRSDAQQQSEDKPDDDATEGKAEGKDDR